MMTDDLEKYEVMARYIESDVAAEAITELVAMVREARAEIKSLRNPFALHLEAQEDFSRIRAARGEKDD